MSLSILLSLLPSICCVLCLDSDISFFERRGWIRHKRKAYFICMSKQKERQIQSREYPENSLVRFVSSLSFFLSFHFIVLFFPCSFLHSLLQWDSGDVFLRKLNGERDRQRQTDREAGGNKEKIGLELPDDLAMARGEREERERQGVRDCHIVPDCLSVCLCLRLSVYACERERETERGAGGRRERRSRRRRRRRRRARKKEWRGTSLNCVQVYGLWDPWWSLLSSLLSHSLTMLSSSPHTSLDWCCRLHLCRTLSSLFSSSLSSIPW